MSPKVQVPLLSHLCVQQVSFQLINALSDDEGANFSTTQAYLQDTTQEMLQELLKTILNAINLDAATRYSCLQLLLRRDVKKLETGMFPHSYYEGILKTITEQGLGLEQLNMKGVWVKEHPDLMTELIKALKKLRVLIIPHMANNEIIESLQSLSQLSVLDISGECLFDASALRKFHSGSLNVLEIGSFGKKYICNEDSFQLVSEMIEHLPNLSYLKTYSYTGSALVLLKKRNPDYRTQLKYLHDTGTNLEIIEAILSLCPNLESIHLDSPEIGVLPRLSTLKRLHCAKLVKYNGDELETLSDQLRTLKLSKSVTSFDLSNAGLHLDTLECFQLSVTFTKLDTYFMNLQHVEILYCDLSDACFKSILTNSPFLKRILVGCVINLTDGDMFRLCAECDFVHLEEIWLSCARGLTAISVELLMSHCPRLKVIGQLTGWDIQQDEFDYLRSVIIHTNTDLTLLPLGLLT